MAQPLVGPDLHQPLDVLGTLAPEISLHEQVFDLIAQLAHLVVGQILDVGVRVDPGLLEDLVRLRAADAVHVREPDLDPLVEGDIDA
jgi:hypothetical protein